MTEIAIHQALREAVVEVLEKMFFIEASEQPVSEGAPEGPAVTVELTFDGDPPGVFRMSLARAATALIAADFLGEDPELLTESQADDVAKELANMICGAVLSRIESSATFRLGAPDLVMGDIDAGSTIRGTVCAVQTGSGILTAEIHTETKACSRTQKSAS